MRWWFRWKIRSLKHELFRKMDQGAHRWIGGVCECGAKANEDCGGCPLREMP